MIVFQVSLNFDPVKEILKIQSQIYILMKKVIILKKLQMKWKLSFHHFSTISVWAWNRKTCGNERHEKETQHIHAFAADLLYVRKKNLDWCKCWHCINDAREIDCLCCREVDAMLIVWLKSEGTKEASCHPAYMGICLTISHTLDLSTCWTKWGWRVRLRFCLLFLVLIRWNKEGRWVQDFLVLPQGFRRFPSIFSQARWCNLVYVKCLDD